MKKLIVVLCGFSIIGCFSCKKTCSCELITVENSTGNVVSTRYEGSHQIDRNSTCDMLANEMTTKNASVKSGVEGFLWLFTFVATGNPFAGIPSYKTRSYYQCTPE